MENPIQDLIKQYSTEFDYSKKETVIILAAGHGKRIKSQTSKMLHKIWEKPTVERVYEACINSIGDANIIIVVGIKAEEVIKTIGKKNSVIYVYQAEQKGTGHAVQVALEKIDSSNYEGNVFVFPGDMGLINEETISDFRNNFILSNSDMSVLTGIYEGNVEENYYGRILRAPIQAAGKSKDASNSDVIGIIEYKDIMNIPERKTFKIKYKKKEFVFKKKDLIQNREFNSSVYAFKFNPLISLIKKIENKNVQQEIYLTDLIYLFNQKGLKVSAHSPKEQHVLMGFNNKSVLKEMDNIARKLVYDRLKDVILIDDPDDFFIDESVVKSILEMDKKGIPLDIKIGKGVYIGRGAHLNYNLNLLKNVFINGNITFGKDVIVKENVQLSCFYGQKMQIEDSVEILTGNIIKGNVHIGKQSVIESGVRITGSDEFPTSIGANVTIKGTSYIFGSIIESNMLIEHSVIIKKRIKRPPNSKQEIYKVRYYIPEPEGKEAIVDLNK